MKIVLNIALSLAITFSILVVFSKTFVPLIEAMSNQMAAFIVERLDNK